MAQNLHLLQVGYENILDFVMSACSTVAYTFSESVL